MKVFTFPLVLSFSCIPIFCMAFDEGTHARISDAAIAQSKLAVPALTASLGLWQNTASPLGRHYLDFVSDLNATIVARSATSFEISKNWMPGADQLSERWKRESIPYFVNGWIMRGAIREDDAKMGLGHPQDDPARPINRFCNHFYDPLYNVKLSSEFCATDAITSAPLWATGALPLQASLGGFAKPLSLSVKDQDRRNHYTLQDAREAMWRALTLRSFRGKSGAIQIDQSGAFTELPLPIHQTIFSQFSPDPVKRKRQIRDGYWATTFFGIGTMLHLNQDMAQPQHTRLEIHPVSYPKEFERYVEARALAAFEPHYRSRYLNMAAKFTLAPLSYASEDGTALQPPSFLEIGDFWSSNTANVGIDKGLGLADFSNSNFFSPYNNLGNQRYPKPSSNISEYQAVKASDPSGAVHTYLDARVVDPLYGSSTVIHKTRAAPLGAWMSAIGLIDDPMSPTGQKDRQWYLLDHPIFDDYAKLLIPRAVAYSAGIINWFFRGSLQISAPDEGVYALVDHTVEADKSTGGFRIMKMKVANTTPGEAMGTGYITAVVKFHRDDCYVSDLATIRPVDYHEAFSVCRTPEEEITVSKPIAISGLSATPEQFTFEFPDKLPINSTDIYLQVIFRGQLGSEPDSVVVGMKDLYEPTHLGYQNDTDYISMGERMYTLKEALAAGMPLLVRISPQTCVMFPPNTIATPCFFEDILTIAFEFGTKPARAMVDLLPVRNFLRVTYLADTPTTTVRSRGTCSSQTLEVPNAKWQVDDPGGRNITYSPTMFRIRGVVNRHHVVCFWYGDGIGPKTEYWEEQMNSIAGTPPVRLKSLEY